MGYDKAALQEYMDRVGAVGEKLQRRQDESLNAFHSCKQQYERIHTKLEEVARRAYNQLEQAESMQRSADLAYAEARIDAETSETDEYRLAAQQRMQQAQEMQMQANGAHARAMVAYEKAAADLRSLTELWDANAPALEAQARRVEDGAATFARLTADGNSALGQYMTVLDKAKAALYDSSASFEPAAAGYGGSRAGGAVAGGASAGASPAGASPAGKTSAGASPAGTIAAEGAPAGSPVAGRTSAGASPAGWCAANSMRAVRVDARGQKSVSMTIGGVERSYPCTASGMAKAYRQAKASGEQDMIERTGAMFEIETLRGDLELGSGESGFAQLGGYHRDVKKHDPAGYESHHIPSRGVQDEDGEMLPTISITRDDHKLTSSYAGKQGKVYRPVFPDGLAPTSYKESVAQNLEEGSAGYIHAIRCELLDLRSTTGHRYDGGISAYLDAVIDMLSTRGIPKAKSGGRK